MTLVPLVFLGTNTLYGGYLNITTNYYPLAVGANAARNVEGWVLTICTVVMMVLAVIILGAAVQKWISVMNGGPGAGHRRNRMSMSFSDAVRAFVDGVRRLFRELYRTPPGC